MECTTNKQQEPNITLNSPHIKNLRTVSRPFYGEYLESNSKSNRGYQLSRRGFFQHSIFGGKTVEMNNAQSVLLFLQLETGISIHKYSILRKKRKGNGGKFLLV